MSLNPKASHRQTRKERLPMPIERKGPSARINNLKLRPALAENRLNIDKMYVV
jgi:hypothetical protein